MNHDDHAKTARSLSNQAIDVGRSGNNEYATWLMSRAQLHATLAVYEALILPSYGISVGEQAEWEREN